MKCAEPATRDEGYGALSPLLRRGLLLTPFERERIDPIMWPFRRRERTVPAAAPVPTEDLRGLLELLLVQRVKAEAECEAKKADAKLATLERELKLKDAELEFYAKRRDEKRKRVAAQPRDPRGGFARRPAVNGNDCRVCTQPGARDLTTAEILFHNAGHRADQLLGDAGTVLTS